MAGGAGTEIGTVYVKVTPDTRGFRRKAEGEINAEMAGVEGETKLKPNAKGFRQKVKAATSNLPASEVEVKANTSSLDKSLAAMKRNMELLNLRWDKQVQRFKADASFDYKFDRRVQAFLKENARLRQLEAEAAERTRLADAKSAAALDLKAASVRADYEAFKTGGEYERNLAAWRLGMANMQRQFQELEFKLRPPDLSNWNPIVLRNRIKNIFSKTPVEVPIVLSDDKAKKQVESLTKKLPTPDSLMPNFGSGINLSGYAAIIAGITLVAAPLLGIITTALLTLPGLIGLVMAPIGAITLGLEGFKNAAKSVEEPFKNLRAEMDKAVESQFTPVFDQLAKGFPMLGRSMPKVSQGLADMAGEVAKFVTEGEGAASIERTIGNIGQAFTDASPGVRDFVAGFTHLAEQFSLQLPGLTDWLNEQGAAFLDWVKGLDLKEAFGNLGTVLDEILATVGELAMSGMDFITDPTAVDGFVTSLKDLLSVFESLADVSAKLGPVWDGLGLIFDAAQMFVNPGLAAKSFGDRFKELLPKSVQDMLPGAKPEDKEGAKNAGAETAEAWIGGGVDALKANPAFKDALTQQISVGGGKGVDGGTIATAQKTIQTNFAAIEAQVNAAWPKIINTIITGANQAIVALTSTWNQLPLIVQTAFGNLAGFASMGMAQVVTAVMTGSNQIVVAFSVPLTRLGQVASTAFLQLAEIVRGAMSQIVSAVLETGNQIGAAMQSWSGIIGSSAASMAAVARAGGVAVGSAFAQGIASMTGAVSSAVAGLMSQARLFFPNSPAKKGPFSGSGWVDKSGEAIGVSFADGIGSTSNQVVDTVRSMMQAVKDVFGDASGLTLNFNFGGLPQQMSGLATSAKDFQSSLVDSANPTKALNAEGKAQLEDLKQQLALLELQRKELKVQKDQAGTKEQKATIQAEIDRIQAMKNQLSLQKDQLAYAEKYGGAVSDTANSYNQHFMDMAKMPWDFAMANGNQLMQDLGIGGGALTNLATKGLEYGSQFIFNVSNIDEAMAVQRNQVNRQAMQYS